MEGNLRRFGGPATATLPLGSVPVAANATWSGSVDLRLRVPLRTPSAKLGKTQMKAGALGSVPPTRIAPKKPEMNVVDLITKKRDGGEHTADELRFLMNGAVQGTIPDYQLAAWAMAVYFRGMTPAEATALTLAMAASGETLDLRGAGASRQADCRQTFQRRRRRQDYADCWPDCSRLRVAGRQDERPRPQLFRRHDRQVGGHSRLERELGRGAVPAPATRGGGWWWPPKPPPWRPPINGSTPCGMSPAPFPALPLIAGSIMSKKLAAGADAIVLDVKCGRGRVYGILAPGQRTGPADGPRLDAAPVAGVTAPDHGDGAAFGTGGRQQPGSARGDRRAPRQRTARLPGVDPGSGI